MRAHTIAMRHSDPFDWGASLGITWLAEASQTEARAYALQLYAEGDHAVCAIGYQLDAGTDMAVLHARLAILCHLIECGQAGAPIPPQMEAFITTRRHGINDAVLAAVGIKYAVTAALGLSCPDPWPHVSYGRVQARRPATLKWSTVPGPVVLWVASNAAGRTAIRWWRW
jgi:hypothetical protein